MTERTTWETTDEDIEGMQELTDGRYPVDMQAAATYIGLHTLIQQRRIADALEKLIGELPNLEVPQEWHDGGYVVPVRAVS